MFSDFLNVYCRHFQRQEVPTRGLRHALRVNTRIMLYGLFSARKGITVQERLEAAGAFRIYRT